MRIYAPAKHTCIQRIPEDGLFDPVEIRFKFQRPFSWSRQWPHSSEGDNMKLVPATGVRIDPAQIQSSLPVGLKGKPGQQGKLFSCASICNLVFCDCARSFFEWIFRVRSSIVRMIFATWTWRKMRHRGCIKISGAKATIGIKDASAVKKNSHGKVHRYSWVGWYRTSGKTLGPGGEAVSMIFLTIRCRDDCYFLQRKSGIFGLTRTK